MANKKKGKQSKQSTAPRKGVERKVVTQKKREIGEGVIILLSFAGSLLVYLILYLIYM